MGSECTNRQCISKNYSYWYVTLFSFENLSICTFTLWVTKQQSFPRGQFFQNLLKIQAPRTTPADAASFLSTRYTQLGANTSATFEAAALQVPRKGSVLQECWKSHLHSKVLSTTFTMTFTLLISPYCNKLGGQSTGGMVLQALICKLFVTGSPK